ncbi:actin-like ATPase domain-containing protein [Penicillium angulare]|uniref:Actin-like ATPase domain-containing protein n=1 Tax=Penicillium angulare TaxID=116970 RepID=A0A9W9F650_9EURO|nr:actin-like ATPase domain-containing protein [Penicillium angulare]
MTTHVPDIVVGIDFGTTASGIGYSIPSLKHFEVFEGLPYVITQKDSDFKASDNSAKTPSILAYAEENPYLLEDTWGFYAEKHQKVVSWFKLFLDDDVDVHNWILDTKQWAGSRGINRLPDGKSPIDVLSDYLSFLRTLLWRRLQSIVLGYCRELQTMRIKFCFTVPGTWSEQAKHDMGLAINKAGFDSRDCDQICLLTEGEAAMNFALSNLGLDDERSALKTGDGVVICDCGGGTIDVASFLISEHSHFIYDELAQGSRFQEFKCQFTGYSGQGFFELELAMAIPGRPNPEWYDQRNNVLISNTDLKKLFEPALQMTIQTLADHINKTNLVKQGQTVINKILLVGGFSFSPYLCREIQRCFPNILVIRNKKHALTAVTRGAVLWGLEKFQQQSMFSPCHYGLRRFLPTDEAFNPRRSLVPADFNLGGSTGPIEWMVKKGDHLRLNEPIQCHGLLLHGQGDSFIKTIDVHSSGSDRPPINIGKRVKSLAGTIHTMVLDLSMIDLNGCQISEQGGRYMHLIQCTFYVQLGKSNGTLFFDAVCQNHHLAHWEMKAGII